VGTGGSCDAQAKVPECVSVILDRTRLCPSSRSRRRRTEIENFFLGVVGGAVLPDIHLGDGVVGRHLAENDAIKSCGFTEANSVLLISRIGKELSRASW
jgi:hypothetical protein